MTAKAKWYNLHGPAWDIVAAKWQDSPSCQQRVINMECCAACVQSIDCDAWTSSSRPASAVALMVESAHGAWHVHTVANSAALTFWLVCRSSEANFHGSVVKLRSRCLGPHDSQSKMVQSARSCLGHCCCQVAGQPILPATGNKYGMLRSLCPEH